MSDVPRPQITNSTTIELPNEGVTNGVLSTIAKHYPVEYDGESDAYQVGEYDE